MCVCTNANANGYVHACIHTYTYKQTCTHVCIHKQLNTHSYIHIIVYIHAYIHTHTCTRVIKLMHEYTNAYM